MKLAERADLRALAQKWLSVPADKGANAGSKVTSLVGGMVSGADSIDDMVVLHHGGMRKLFTACYAPSMLGSFRRQFTFGHVRQLDAVASRFLRNLTDEAPLLTKDDADEYVFLDVDDTIIQVHGHPKQGSGYGYSGVRGINALLATVKTSTSAPIIIGQRLRRGASGSRRGATQLISDALAATHRLAGMKDAGVLSHADSAYYGYAAINAAITDEASRTWIDAAAIPRLQPGAAARTVVQLKSLSDGLTAKEQQLAEALSANASLRRTPRWPQAALRSSERSEWRARTPREIAPEQPAHCRHLEAARHDVGRNCPACESNPFLPGCSARPVA